MKPSCLALVLCAALGACSQTANDVAPDASTGGMEQQSPTGVSGMSSGTSNTLNHAR